MIQGTRLDAGDGMRDGLDRVPEDGLKDGLDRTPGHRLKDRVRQRT